MRGVRFAPSPTGPLHVGNLRTALLSERIARSLREPWIIRVEDLDAPRVMAGSQDQQLRDLEALGLKPDKIVVQSANEPRHWELFLRALEDNVLYPCFCSRAEIQAELAGLASAPHTAATVYSGRCRAAAARDPASRHETIGWRFRAEDPSGFADFLVARSRAYPIDPSATPEAAGFQAAYHWACAIDDADGAYALLVRAWDLLDAAGPQRAVQQWMSALSVRSFRPIPIFHTALVLRNDGTRLEKRLRGLTLKDLAEEGVSTAEALARIVATLPGHLPVAVPAIGSLVGESNRSLTLSEMGFSER